MLVEAVAAHNGNWRVVVAESDSSFLPGLYVDDST